MKLDQHGLPRGFEPKAVLVRLGIASVLAVSLAILLAKPTATALLPLYRAMLERIADDYRILFLGVAMEGADSAIRLDVTLVHAIVVMGHLVLPTPQVAANATIMIGNIMQPVTVGLIAILAWPARCWRIVLLRLPFLVLLDLIETVLDIPLLLTGNLWGLFLDNLAPGNWSPLTLWVDFLENGGRFALGIATALVSIAGANYVARKSRIAFRPAITRTGV
jgi:hypothetical protein